MDIVNNRSPKFWLWLICLLFAGVIVAAALFTHSLRDSQFQIRLENAYRKELRLLEATQSSLQQQALTTAHLLAENQQVTQLLAAAAVVYKTNPNQAALEVVRQQLHQVIQPYWLYLKQHGVKQLQFHLAPNDFMLYRAQHTEFHSDVLADTRPLVQQVFHLAEAGVGVEVGASGIGLRAVVPVIVNNVAVAAIEVGYGVAGVGATNSTEAAVPLQPESGTTFIIKRHVAAVMTDTAIAKQATKTRTPWVSEHAYLNDNHLLALVPASIDRPLYLTIAHQRRQILLTLLPWQQFGASSLEADVVLANWQDISPIVEDKRNTDLIISLVWLLMLVSGVLFVYLLSKKLQKSTTAVLREQQKELVWSQQKLNALFELSPYSISLNRLSDGTYLSVNPAMTSLTGYSLNELKLLSYWDLTPQVFELQEQAQLRLLHETGRYGPYRKQYKRKDGSLVDIELSGVKFSSPSGEEMIWSIITDLRESLKLERLKQDFISTVSHELRTPLTSINGSLDLLLSGAAGELQPKAQKLISIAAKNNKRLITLVNDLLDMEKLTQGKLLFKPLLINSFVLIEAIMENNMPFALLHKVQLRKGHVDDVRLFVDADRIQQVLTNLISNAAKFSPEGSTVLIHTQVKNGVFRISVTDEGKGLTAEQISKLFQRFMQIDHPNATQHAGSGLGLAISREIMLQSAGQIGVESEPGVGSTFWIELPLEQKQEDSSSVRKILVVEDDPDTAETIKELLLAAGYEADVAYQLDQAWSLLQHKRYDLITLDLNLNGENGGEFFLKLRDSTEHATLPVLVISAFIERGKLQLNAIANTIDWLEKPFNVESLAQKIDRLMSLGDPQWSSARILHVEDDMDIVTIMQMQLEDRFHYHHAGSLADARAKLRANRYDLVLLDIGLPDGNGWQLIPDVEMTHGKIPVIVFSALDVSVDQQNKASAVFGKTKLAPCALVDEISQMLGMKQQ